MNKNYLKVGCGYTDSDQKKDKLWLAISEIQWHKKEEGKLELPFMQGFGMKEFIKAFGNNVSRIGYATQNGYAIYGLENNYTNGEVKKAILYAIDDGFETITPVVVVEYTAEDIAAEEKRDEKNMDDLDRLTELAENNKNLLL